MQTVECQLTLLDILSRRTFSEALQKLPLARLRGQVATVGATHCPPSLLRSELRVSFHAYEMGGFPSAFAKAEKQKRPGTISRAEAS
jgi:hypothetical protein